VGAILTQRRGEAETQSGEDKEWEGETRGSETNPFIFSSLLILLLFFFSSSPLLLRVSALNSFSFASWR
jgi:hypothetical protein